MRGEDVKQVERIVTAWRAGKLPDVRCELLVDPEKLVAQLDAMGFRPGDALLPCPSCGGHHRWALLYELLEAILDRRKAGESNILRLVDIRIYEVAESYGGREGYAAYRAKAAEYFSKVAENLGKPVDAYRGR
ncbi:MAG: hypothetical protein FIB06_05580 [Betaproteobacteria bacterium]|nr:hypothetical protein [Betaproteobacteria bacterium]